MPRLLLSPPSPWAAPRHSDTRHRPSVGSSLALASVIGALTCQAVDSSFLVILAMISTGALVGATNGLVYVFGRLPHPFIITLATLSIAKGLALQLSDGRALPGMPDAITFIGHESIGWLPISAFVVAALALVLFVFTKFMV